MLDLHKVRKIQRCVATHRYARMLAGIHEYTTLILQATAQSRVHELCELALKNLLGVEHLVGDVFRPGLDRDDMANLISRMRGVFIEVGA